MGQLLLFRIDSCYSLYRLNQQRFPLLIFIKFRLYMIPVYSVFRHVSLYMLSYNREWTLNCNYKGSNYWRRTDTYRRQYYLNPRQLGTWTFRYWLGQVGIELDISVLSTGQFGTWMRQFGTDHNCLVLINCQNFCNSNSLIYDPKVDVLIVPV